MRKTQNQITFLQYIFKQKRKPNFWLKVRYYRK